MQEPAKLLQRPGPVREAVLLRLGHLREPACESVSLSGSGPENARLSRVLRLEHRVPAEVPGPARGDDAPLCAPLEEKGLGAGPCAVGARADRGRVGRGEADQELVDAWGMVWGK